jgi:hypothetical protein
MKIRTFLLFACMIVVPMLAMFSHKIPPDFRQAARRHLWEPAQRALVGSETAPEAAAVASMPTVTISETVALPAPEPSFSEPEPASSAPARPAASLLASPREPASPREIESRLAALGGFAFECVPETGDGGIHRCSCRVAADPSGQLQRVFQSSGRDPVAAMQQLLEQVEVWKERMASSPTSPPTRRF